MRGLECERNSLGDVYFSSSQVNSYSALADCDTHCIRYCENETEWASVMFSNFLKDVTVVLPGSQVKPEVYRKLLFLAQAQQS